VPGMPDRPALDPDSREYLYDQLAALIRKRIWAGELPPGRRVPSKRDLIQEHGISGRTVDTAMGILKAEGLIETRLGLGLVVLPRAAWKRLPPGPA
jgi:DNA-binding GntR family transcriptional regulator